VTNQAVISINAGMSKASFLALGQQGRAGLKCSRYFVLKNLLSQLEINGLMRFSEAFCSD